MVWLVSLLLLQADSRTALMLEGLSGSQEMFATAAAVLECCVSRGLLFPECKGIADLRQTLEETLRHLLKSLKMDIVKSWSYGPPGFHL